MSRQLIDVPLTLLDQGPNVRSRADAGLTKSVREHGVLREPGLVSGLPMTISMRTDSSEEWATPVGLFDALYDEFRFDLDVAASAENTKCPRFFTEADNGLWQSWAPSRCWMNPPYGRSTTQWVRKAVIESMRGALVVGLLPARTDTAWFHENVIEAGAEIRFVRGRVAFDGPSRVVPRAPFPSLVVVWRPPTWIGGRA